MDILKLASHFFKVPLDTLDLDTEVDLLCVLKCARVKYSNQIDRFFTKLSQFPRKNFYREKSGGIIYFDLGSIFKTNGIKEDTVCLYSDQRNKDGFFKWQLENMGFAIEVFDHFYSKKMTFYELWFCLMALNNKKDDLVLGDLIGLERFSPSKLPGRYLFRDN